MGQDSRGLDNIKGEGERTDAIKKAWGDTHAFKYMYFDSGQGVTCKCAQKGASFSGWKPHLLRCNHTINSEPCARHGDVLGKA